MSQRKSLFCFRGGDVIFIHGEYLWSWGYNAGTLGYMNYEKKEEAIQDESSSEDEMFNYNSTNSHHQITPRQVIGLEDVKIVSVGTNTFTSLFIDSDGDVYFCGIDPLTFLGENLTSILPKKMERFANIVSVFSGASFSFFIDSEENVWGYGMNGHGQLGLGYAESSSTLTLIPKLKGMNHFQCYNNNVCCLDKNNQVWVIGCFMKDLVGGQPEDCYYPQPHPYLKDVYKFTVFNGYIGSIYNNRELHFVELFSKSEGLPLDIEFIPELISGRNESLYIIDTDSKVWIIEHADVFEMNSFSIQKLDLPSIVEIESSYSCTLMKDINGTVWTHGQNDVGQLGIGNSETYSCPIQIPQDFNFPNYTCAKSARSII